MILKRILRLFLAVGVLTACAAPALAGGGTAPAYVPSTVRSIVQLNIQKLLRHALTAQAADQGVTPVMASPPTISVGAANANSSIQTAATISAPTIGSNDTRFTVKGGLAWLSFGTTYQFKWVGSTQTGQAHLPNACVTFMTDALSFDLPVFASTTDNAIRVRVNGQWVSAAGEVAANDNTNWYYIKYTFANRAPRKVDLCFAANQYWRGINIPTGASIWAINSADDVISLWEGDSITEGVSYGLGSNTFVVPRNGFIYAAGEALGIDDPIALGLPGTGYIAQSTSQNSITRIAEMSRFGNVNLIEIWQGINDSLTTQSTTALTAAVETYLQAVMAAQPTAVIIVGGPWSGAVNGAINNVTTQAYYNAVKTAFLAVYDPTRMCYIDNSPSGENWQNGTGYEGATNGSGNSDWYIGTDATHPSDLTSGPSTNPAAGSGHRYLGQRVAADTLACLRSLQSVAPTS